MLFESAHIRVTVEFGIATLWLGFPGEPVNALDVARLRELDAAIAPLEVNPQIRIVVVRSAKPAGFCAGIHPDALANLTTHSDRAAFAWLGQTLFSRLSTLDATTVAFIDGPCLGAGFELALACDYRLCLARMSTHLGFPERVPPSFGGSVRLTRKLGARRARQFLEAGGTLSGREARKLGLIDRAFCERRAKIELRTFLDELECSLRRPKRFREQAGFAEERREFAEATTTATAEISRSPLGCGYAEIANALARGFITPLEAEQLRSRLAASSPLLPTTRRVEELELAAA